MMVVAHLNIIYLHLSGDAEENDDKSQDRQ
jgi:hypothetical protein